MVFILHLKLALYTKVKIKLTTKSWQKLRADDFRLKENREMQWVDGSTFEVRVPTQTWSLNCQVSNTYKHALRTWNVEKHPGLAFDVHNKTSLFKLSINFYSILPRGTKI